MYRSFLQWGVGLAAALTLTVTGQPADGQGPEYVVDSRIVSDTVIDADGGTSSYVGDVATSADGFSYVGDGGLGFCLNRRYGQPDLFYNFYTQGNCNRVNAQMYVSPLPVPPFVGHTFFTYQPFYPHEMLYWHKDRFHNYYDGGRGMNRTRAVYYSPPVRQALSNIYWNKIRIPR